MGDSNGSDSKLREEIEAELDKISISSLENDEVENDSESETQSDSSGTDVLELPESVLHYINILKNKSKIAEELILQDYEDADIFRCHYSTVSNSHMHLRTGSLPEAKANSEQLMKILSVIDKEEFMRCVAPSARCVSVPEPITLDTPMDEYILPDEADLSFGYCEVEEQCRKSFEAWQDKQQELEVKDKETLEAQSDREKQNFQEEDEKRQCWIRKFEVEKKKLENLQKQDQDKMNDELHKEEKIWKEKYRQHEELIRNLHLQMEEERKRLSELQEKEKARLFKLQHDAAAKIQANYRASVTYRKYSPIIKEQIEKKKRKAQELKEKEAKIRQKEEERRRRIEEEQRIEEEKKKKVLEERRTREREYEEKKRILRQKREEQRNKEKRLKEDAHSPLIINKALTCALQKEECHSKQRAIMHMSKSKGTIAKESVDSNSKNQEDACSQVHQLNKNENMHEQLGLKESTGIKLKPSQANLAELNLNEKNESLPKLKMNKNLSKNQCSEQSAVQEINTENVDRKNDSENSDLKENVNEQCQGQELKSENLTEDCVEHATQENVAQETPKLFRFNEDLSEGDSNGTQGIIEKNHKRLAQEMEIKEVTDQDGYEENNSKPIFMQKTLPPLIPDNPVERSVTAKDQETGLKSERIKQPPESVLTCDAVIINSDACKHTEDEANLQGSVSSKLAPSEEAGSHSANNPLVTEEREDFPNSEIKETLEQGKQTEPEDNDVLACSVSQLTVLSSVEERRLGWLRSFTPWTEIFEQNQLKKIVKKRRLVKCPPNTVPALDPSDILQQGPWKTLQQVTAITFQDLPSCSLSTLAECSSLQLLSLRRCGLTSLQGLSHCTNLKYIDAQENHIETISCENLENLSVVLLNKNLLTSIHGFDGCTNIQSLELSHNKITRISGLESLKSLQQLIMDHNQLISTKGLCEAPTIMYLDCSHNHLTDVDGIENCGLLQIVKLQGNYLREPPSLRNHVLLRELHLEDNSISSVERLSSCWLPLLQDLSISQNSLGTIVPLFHFVSLEKLDVSNNCLSDLTNVMCWFNACHSLCELCLSGNPVLQEINWRHSIIKILPALRVLNGDVLNSSSNVHVEEYYHQDLRCFLALCQYQLQEFNLLSEKYITQKGDILSPHAVAKLSEYYKDLMSLSKECRRAHEQGDVIIKKSAAETEKDYPAFPNTHNTLQNRTVQPQSNNCKADSPAVSAVLLDAASRPSTSNCEELKGNNQEKLMAQTSELSSTSSPSSSRASFIKMKMAESPMSNHPNTEQRASVEAAMVIQEQWCSYIACKEINCSAKMHPTTTEPLHDPFLNNQTTSNEEQRKTKNTQEEKEKAALHIQAVWKGFILRKKLVTALEAIKNEESGEEYEEINLEDFEFDEDALEKDWPALDPTGFPSQTPPLSTQLPWPKNSQSLRHDETSPTVPACPAQAWLCNEKENVFSSEHTQLSSRSDSGTLSWTPESKTSRKSVLQSEKEEKISEEWGFKDISTAQQMLKRAKKMKSKKLRKKLGSALKSSRTQVSCHLRLQASEAEPSVRLALFKRNKNKVSVTKSSKKTQLRREDYFEDEEEEAVSKATAAQEKLERSKEYTYQWLHTQVCFPEATSSRNLKCHHFLPELDPDVLNGGRVQLVARLVSREDTDLDLFSMTSASALSLNKEKKSQTQRYSAGSASCSSKGVTAPVMTHPRPSGKERISFRDNPVRLSGGWGSGKKKVKSST